MDKKLPFDVMYDFILPKDLLLSNNQVAKLQCINMCIWSFKSLLQTTQMTDNELYDFAN